MKRRVDVRADEREARAMIVLRRDPRLPVEARHWLGWFLDDRVAERTVTDAVLVVSELSTNALRHGLGDVVVRAAIDVDGSIRMSVTDSGDELPVMLPADPARLGGLGLRIVDQVSVSWGVAAFPGGKTVWATLAALPG